MVENCNRKFFENALAFLKDHDWIFNYPNTHILVNGILNYIPLEWHLYLKNIEIRDLNDLPTGRINPDWPITLKKFLQNIKDLNYKINNYDLITEPIELVNKTGIGLKKCHEISSLAAVIQAECEKDDIKYIIDAGAGLGYLSQLLQEKFNYTILAIEGNSNNLKLAIKNQDKFYPDSKNSVKYVGHFITEQTDLAALLNEHYNWSNQNVCITGLHACADLSIVLLKLFLKFNFVKSLVIMPCCYHRLELEFSTVQADSFQNFPISRSLRGIYDGFNAGIFLRRPFMRLACQQSRGLWTSMSSLDHEKHEKSCTFRAIVQEVAEKDDQWILSFLRGCKFSLERTKKKIDLFYTFKNLSSYLMGVKDPVLPEIQELLKPSIFICLLKSYKPAGPRLVIFRPGQCDVNKFSILTMFTTALMILEFLMMEDDTFVTMGAEVIVDMKNFPANFFKQVTPNIIKTIVLGFQNVYPIRMKRAHILNAPRMIDAIYAVVQTFLSKKIQDRVKFYCKDDIDDLYKVIPRTLWPQEYGGDEASVDVLAADLKTKIENYRDWFLEDENYFCDESKRLGKAPFMHDTLSVDGSFRQLTID